MNRTRRRTSAGSLRPHARAVTTGLAACGLLAAAALAGCGSGQVSQMATQAPAVNGTEATLGPIALRNVLLRADQTGAFIEPGEEVELEFFVANNSPDTEDTLVSITSEVGSVSLSDETIPPGAALMVGEPDGRLQAVEDAEDIETAEATVALSERISNGLLYDFTFTFERAGETTLSVPISAGDSPRQEPVPGKADTGGHH